MRITQVMDPVYHIRPYRRNDRDAVREICVATAWMGQPAPERIPDEWIWAEYWTRYFTDRDPRHTWVAVRSADGVVVGYLTGTTDASRIERYVPWLLPGIVWRVVTRRLLRRTQSRAAILGLVKSALCGELDVPAWVRRQFPATLHIDLLAEARGHGLGRQFFETYIAAMRAAGVAGVHAQTLSANVEIARLNEAMGFRLVASRRFRAYEYLDPAPTQIHTWTLGLRADTGPRA